MDFIINGVVLQKLQALDEALAEIRSLGQISISQLKTDWRTCRAVERDLQVLVEIVIDVCQRLISLAGQTPTATGGEALQRCVQLGVLASDEPYRSMVQFRNLIVHHYHRLDVEILASIVNRHLGDFEQFRNEILKYVQR